MSNGTVQLTTERLILRRHILEDALLLHQNFGLDPEMFRYSGWNPYASKEAAEETVRQFMDSYSDKHFYGWAIEFDGRLIGTIGAYDYDPETDSIEVGCSIERKSWGNGFAGEAVRAVIRYLTEQEGIRCVKAWCAAENIGSRKVMERAGMTRVSTEKDALEIEGRKYDKQNYRITMLRVRKAEACDYEQIMKIYRFAQDFMIEAGNPNQWGHFYPAPELVKDDIEQEVCHVIADEETVHGVFALFRGQEPTYRYIENGSWPNDEPYVTIHRIAGDGQAHGIFRCAADYCKSISSNVRIDTHENNTTMQRQIEKAGFKRCGTIYVEDGSPRIAYQWTAD